MMPGWTCSTQNLCNEKMTNMDLTPGVYQHYKGKKYFVLGLSRNTETGEVCVVYRPLYETDWPHLVHRNAAMFFENVTVDGKEMPRFRLVAA
ncbi:MAG: hypothetical protein V7642_5441 [Burkholderiales bacterium]